MWGMSLAHWAIVVAVVVLLFGRNVVSRLMADIGGGIKNARVAMRELERSDADSR